jgi:hypothetical protein
MRNGARHFTITSQSAEDQARPDLQGLQNESILQSKRTIVDLRSGSMPKTVNVQEPPSEEQKLIDPPSSG